MPLIQSKNNKLWENSLKSLLITENKEMTHSSVCKSKSSLKTGVKSPFDDQEQLIHYDLEFTTQRQN